MKKRSNSMILSIICLILLSAASVSCLRQHNIVRSEGTSVTKSLHGMKYNIENNSLQKLYKNKESQLLLYKRVSGGASVNRITKKKILSESTIVGIKNGIASGLSAACVKTLLQPFDTVKTVQQASKAKLTLIAATKNIIERQGLQSLWSGLPVNLAGSIPSVAVYFGVYQYTRKKISKILNQDKKWAFIMGICISAAIGNTIASIVKVPYEVVKQRLQTGMYSSISDAIKKLFILSVGDGLLGLLSSSNLAVQMIRDVPYAIITFLIYETLHSLNRKRCLSIGRNASATTLENSLIGVTSGGIGTLLTNPMDVIKTKVMTKPDIYSGAFQAALKVLNDEGIDAFFKGVGPRLLYKMPSNGIFFALYEFFRRYLLALN